MNRKIYLLYSPHYGGTMSIEFTIGNETYSTDPVLFWNKTGFKESYRNLRILIKETLIQNEWNYLTVKR